MGFKGADKEIRRAYHLLKQAEALLILVEKDTKDARILGAFQDIKEAINEIEKVHKEIKKLWKSS